MTGKDGRLDDPGRRSFNGYSSVKDSIEDAIRDAVEKRGGVVESADDLPDFSWFGLAPLMTFRQPLIGSAALMLATHIWLPPIVIPELWVSR